MIVKVDLELGQTPVSAVRCEGKDGRPARTVEEAVARFNSQASSHLQQFRTYGRRIPGGRPEVFGKLHHEDGFIQVIVEARNLSVACDLAVGLLMARSA